MQRPSDVRASFYRAPYRYGARKWEDYLLDTQTLIYDGARAQVEAVERVGQQAEEQRNHQFTLLEDFIAESGTAWDRVSTQLDTLTEELVSGFTALSYQLKYHGQLLQQIVDRLGHIAKILANPLATQANELVQSGQHLMQRGLYREAYSDLIAAESKRSVNPMLHVYLTELHYKIRDEGVPFDLSAAEQHVNLAIRYATSLRGDLAEKGAPVVDLVFRTAAHLALVKGGDLTKMARPEEGAVELRRADSYLRQIDQSSPSSKFLHAQVLALVERTDESLALITDLADFTRSWIPRTLLEPNLEAIADQARVLNDTLRTTPGVHSKNVYRTVRICKDFLELCSTMTLTGASVSSLDSAASDLSAQISDIELDFETGAIDAATAIKRLEGALHSAEKKTFEIINASASELAVAKDRFIDSAVASETQLEAKRHEASMTAHAHNMRAEDLLVAAREARAGSLVILGFGALAALVLAGVVSDQGLTKSPSLFALYASGVLLAALVGAPMTHLKNRNSRMACSAEEAAATHAREQATQIERRLDNGKQSSRQRVIQMKQEILDLERLRDAVTAMMRDRS